MKKYLLKTIYFLLPLLLLYAYAQIFYSTKKGDLLRIGFVRDLTFNYRDQFKNDFERKHNYVRLSELNMNNPHKFKAITIGDSFSEQGSYDYKSYWGEADSTAILHMDMFLHVNPIQSLHSFLNSDFFDRVKVEYVVLESAERFIVNRSITVNKDSVLSCRDIATLSEKQNKNPVPFGFDKGDQFPTSRVLKVPLYNLLYLFKDNAWFSQTYKVKTTEKLFDVNLKEVLFYHQDIDALTFNNDSTLVRKLNEDLNNLNTTLNNRGIKLILLPSPDKYDIYYDYFSNKKDYTRPMFFTYFNDLPKQYHYIDTKKVLGDAIKKQKDIYFYDDTHWSPLASKLIGAELNKIVPIGK